MLYIILLIIIAVVGYSLFKGGLANATLNRKVGIFALLAGLVLILFSPIMHLLLLLAKILFLIVAVTLLVGIYKSVFLRR